MCIATNTDTTSPGSGPSPYDDNRPLVSDLLGKHAEMIATVREEIEQDPLYDPVRYDNIWILRYVMSHKKAKPATEAALKTIKYRHENKVNELGDVRHRIYNHTATNEEGNADCFPIHKRYFDYCSHNDGVMHTLPDPDRGVVIYVRLGHINLRGLAQDLTAEDLAQVYMLMNEAEFQIVDEVTRRTGRLTKCLRVVDLVDLSFSGVDRNYAKLDGAVTKKLEDLYPQLLETAVVVNAPSWAYTTWSVLRSFFPKRVVDKFDFVSPKKYKKDLRKLERYISKEDLPGRYGGETPVWPPPYAGEHFRSQNSSRQNDKALVGRGAINCGVLCGGNF